MRLFRIRPWMILVGTFAACASACWWALIREEPSPPESLAGTDPAFDQSLAGVGEGRLFLFDEDSRLVAASLGAGGERVLLDIPHFSGHAKASVSGPVISPNRHRVLVPFYRKPGMGGPSLALLNLATGLVEEVTIPPVPADPAAPTRGVYEFTLRVPFPLWLSDDVFALSLIWYPPGDSPSYRLKFFRYDLARLGGPREVDLGHRDPVFRITTGGTLLVGDQCRTTEANVRAWESSGLRPATAEERQAFAAPGLGIGPPEPPSPRPVELVRRTRNGFDDKGPHYYEIRFGRRLVRRTEDNLWCSGPRWEPALGLYWWTEAPYSGEASTFVADSRGRYRRWRHGVFVGEVPAAMIGKLP